MARSFKPAFLQQAAREAASAITLEDSRVRAAAKLRGLLPGAIFQAAGKQAGDKLTFDDLTSHFEFPRAVVVTGVEPVSIHTVLVAFPATRLYEAWLEAWEQRPQIRQSRRVLLFRGGEWGTAVLYDNVNDLTAAHLRLEIAPDPTRPLRLFISDYGTWLKQIGWTQSDPDRNDET